jgi:hypothetical protein
MKQEGTEGAEPATWNAGSSFKSGARRGRGKIAQPNFGFPAPQFQNRALSILISLILCHDFC